MSLTGDFVDAATELAWGLVTEVTTHDALLERSVEVAATIAGLDPMVVTELREMYDQIGNLTGHEAWRVENQWSKTWIQDRFDQDRLSDKADAIIKAERAASLAGISLALEAFLAEPGNEAFTPRLLQPDPVPLSGKRPEDVAELREFMAHHLPEGPWLFADDDLTDMPRYFICAELIREQIFRQLSQEIPYGTAVKVTAVEFKGDLVVVRATAVVSRASHKPILLGKGGARIKSIGTAARASLENHFDKKVFLELQVAVAEGWTDDQRLIADLANLSEEDLRGTANIEPEQAPLH